MAGVWQAVLQASCPRDIVDGKVPGVEAMQAAREEVTGEVNKHARAPPKFSADGKLPQLLTIGEVVMHIALHHDTSVLLLGSLCIWHANTQLHRRSSVALHIILDYPPK